MTNESENHLSLVLGTVQLGLDYGIANRTGRPGPDMAFSIVKTAWNRGLRYFDTAQAYGESEKVLGRCFSKLSKRQDIRPKVISKLRPDFDPGDTRGIRKEVEASLKRLAVEKLWGFMLHRESWLDRGIDPLLEVVHEIRAEGKIDYFGVSVYAPEKAVQALNTEGIDIVQMPFNVFDQRALEKGVFQLAAKTGKHIFIRSVYLQGLLLMNPDQIPPGMGMQKEGLKRFRSIIEKEGIPPQLAALAFAVQNATGAFLVIGSEIPEQVGENIDLYRKALKTPLPDLSALSSRDPQLIVPSLWKQ